MFRHLLMAIFRLYMKTLFVSSYTKHIYGLLICGWEGVKWAWDLVPVLKVGWCGLQISASSWCYYKNISRCTVT